MKTGHEQVRQVDDVRDRAVAPRVCRLVVEADTAGRIREDVLPESTSVELLEHLRQVGLSRGYALSPRALFAAFAGWTAVHGMVSLELSDQLMVFGTYSAEFFRAEVQRYIESIRKV